MRFSLWQNNKMIHICLQQTINVNVVKSLLPVCRLLWSACTGPLCQSCPRRTWGWTPGSCCCYCGIRWRSSWRWWRRAFPPSPSSWRLSRWVSRLCWWRHSGLPTPGIWGLSYSEFLFHCSCKFGPPSLIVQVKLPSSVGFHRSVKLAHFFKFLRPLGTFKSGAKFVSESSESLCTAFNFYWPTRFIIQILDTLSALSSSDFLIIQKDILCFPIVIWNNNWDIHYIW